MIQMNLFTKQKETHRLREPIYSYGAGAGSEGIASESGMDMHTLVYLKEVANKDLLYSTGNSARYHVAAWAGREVGGEWTHVWLRPFAVHLKLSQHR